MLALLDRPSLDSHPENITAALDCLSQERRQTVERQLGADALDLHSRVLGDAVAKQLDEIEIPHALTRPDIVGVATIYAMTKARLAASRRVATDPTDPTRHFIVPLKPDIL